MPRSSREALPHKGQSDSQVHVPLAKLSASNRRWVEDHNPCETSLSERSKDGAVGTLALRNGDYRITKIVDDEHGPHRLRSE